MVYRWAEQTEEERKQWGRVGQTWWAEHYKWREEKNQQLLPVCLVCDLNGCLCHLLTRRRLGEVKMWRMTRRRKKSCMNQVKENLNAWSLFYYWGTLQTKKSSVLDLLYVNLMPYEIMSQLHYVRRDRIIKYTVILWFCEIYPSWKAPLKIFSPIYTDRSPASLHI